MENAESFSKLFDCLTKSLEKNIEINYSTKRISPDCAVGVLLSRIPNYKPHLLKKIQEDYKKMQKSLKKILFSERKIPEIDPLIKKLLKTSEVYLAYFARKQRNSIRSCLEKTRKWFFKAITSLAKESILCKLLMTNSNSNYQLKLQEFSEDYSWKRFFFYLEGIASGFARVSEKKILKDTKERIENFLKHPVKINKHVCIENLYFSENAEKKSQKKCSNYCIFIYR